MKNILLLLAALHLPIGAAAADSRALDDARAAAGALLGGGTIVAADAPPVGAERAEAAPAPVRPRGGRALGFYSGSFDPPTIAHRDIIRSALAHYPLGTLYVLVNETGVKHYKAPATDRVEMVRRMTSELGGRVVVLGVRQEDKNRRIAELGAAAASTFRFIGEDSYLALPDALRRDPAVSWVIVPRPAERAAGAALPQAPNASTLPLAASDEDVSSTRAREELGRGASPAILDPRVAEYVRQRGLYRDGSR